MLARGNVSWATTAAAVEAAATGLLVLLSPSLFGWLIMGSEFTEPGNAVGHLGGIALLGFASTSWPTPAARSVTRAFLVYNVLITAYLCFLGFGGTLVGLLLWPAVVIHVLLTGFLASSLRAGNVT